VGSPFVRLSPLHSERILFVCPLPWMDPAKLTLVRQPFDHPDFLFELKHDGFRTLAYISDGHCELISRRRNSYKSFAELRTHLAGLKVKNAVIDGSLHLNGLDLRQLPLTERKGKLCALIEKSALPDVLGGKYVEGRGVDLFNEVPRRNLEGAVAKRKTGTYSVVSGWLKIKNPQYTQTERRHELFESFKAKQTTKVLPPIPKKLPVRTRTTQTSQVQRDGKAYRR
jgi:ATP-dependent DNA ligase